MFCKAVNLVACSPAFVSGKAKASIMSCLGCKAVIALFTLLALGPWFQAACSAGVPVAPWLSRKSIKAFSLAVI